MLLRHPPCRIGMPIDQADDARIRRAPALPAGGGAVATQPNPTTAVRSRTLTVSRPITSTHPLCDSFAGTSALSPTPRALPSTPAIGRGMRGTGPAHTKRALNLDRRLPSGQSVEHAAGKAGNRFPAPHVAPRQKRARFDKPQSGRTQRPPPLLHCPVAQMGETLVETRQIIAA